MSDNNKGQISPITEGACPCCGANLNFSEKDRSGGEKILCPKCKKEFGIEEVKVLKKKKKEKGCLIAALVFFGISFLIGFIVVFNAMKDLEDIERRPPRQVEKPEEEEVVSEEMDSERGEEDTEVEESTVPEYPSLTEETMDRNLVLSCEGGDEVVLWDLPTSAGEGARGRDKVPCGTYGWAFNEYYNEELGISFFAINTLDSRVNNAYGWITEDLISWRE